jgi:hypothetical protein
MEAISNLPASSSAEWWMTKNDCDCRLEWYLGEELILDIDSPMEPIGKFPEVLSWVEQQIRRVVLELSDEERKRFHGTVHFRIFTDNINSSFTVPAKVAKALGNMRLDVRFVYFCSSEPGAEG